MRNPGSTSALWLAGVRIPPGKQLLDLDCTVTELRRPAVKIQQGRRTLFLTSFTVGDFLSEGFYQVDRLDVQEATGMQRLLNETRAKSFGRDMSEADSLDEAFLPTSVFLATSGTISFDEQRKELFFDSAEHYGICPFDVVDGQHRIEGLRFAVEKNKRLYNFPISVVLAHDMTETEKMLQFITVNTKQKTVDKGVAQHITARFTRMDGVEGLPHLPSWLRRDVERGGDDLALEIAIQLSADSSSPWFGRIQFADEPKQRRHSITQNTFVSALKRIVLNKYHPYGELPMAQSKKIAVMKNYFDAVEEVCGGESYRLDGKAAPVVYKFNGVEFFFSVFAGMLNVQLKDRNFTRDAFVARFRTAEEYLGPDVVGVVTPAYWQVGEDASGHNRSGISQVAAKLTEAIYASSGEEIVV